MQQNEQLQRDASRLLTFQEAATALGIPYFKIQRAARGGMIPTYTLFNSRKYVKLSDIAAAMTAQRSS
jgi:predicted site-specific integrase-resolvase